MSKYSVSKLYGLSLALLSLSSGCFDADNMSWGYLNGPDGENQQTIGSTSYTWSLNSPSSYVYNSNEILFGSNEAALRPLNQKVDSYETCSQGTSNSASCGTSGIFPFSLSINGSNTSAVYTSKVYDVGAPVPWNAIRFVGAKPYKKSLPNYGLSESDYASGNVSMLNNSILYHFDDSFTANMIGDFSGNSNTATCSSINCPTLSVGKLGNGASFDGIDDYLTISDNSTTRFGGTVTQFTVMGWVSSNTSASLATLFQKSDGSNVIEAYMGAYSDRRICAKVQNSAPETLTWCPAADFSNGWHHFAIVFSMAGMTGKLEIYRDGVSQGSTTTLFSTTPSMSGGSLLVGAGAGPTSAYGGLMDELAFFDRALTATEIGDIYLRGALQVDLRVRGCTDATCSATNWTGSDGSSMTYFNELQNSTVHLPIFSLSNLFSRFFQFEITLSRDSMTLESPVIKLISIGPAHYSVAGSLLTPMQGVTYQHLYGFKAYGGTSNQSDLKFQISNNGINYYYYTSGAWTEAISSTQANDADTISSNISAFSETKGPGTLYFKAILKSNTGSEPASLSEVTLTYD